MQPGQATLVLHGVMQERRDYHVFRHRKGNVAALSHHQRSNSEQMGHIGHVRPFAPASVYLPCIIHGLNEAACKNECSMLFFGAHGLHSPELRESHGQACITDLPQREQIFVAGTACPFMQRRTFAFAFAAE